MNRSFYCVLSLIIFFLYPSSWSQENSSPTLERDFKKKRDGAGHCDSRRAEVYLKGRLRRNVEYWDLPCLPGRPPKIVRAISMRYSASSGAQNAA